MFIDSLGTPLFKAPSRQPPLPQVEEYTSIVHHFGPVCVCVCVCVCVPCALIILVHLCLKPLADIPPHCPRWRNTHQLSTILALCACSGPFRKKVTSPSQPCPVRNIPNVDP